MLLALLSGILLAAGSALGGVNGLRIAFIIALAMNAFAYFFSDKMVLSMYKAKPLDPKQYDWLYALVGDLARRMSIPMPKLWLVETPVANAFATGRNPSHASVAVTTGILGILDERELRGVLSHELSHVKNRDILVATIAATVATAIATLADFFRYQAIFGSTTRGDSEGNRGPGLLGSIIMILILPIAASIIQMGISRTREYLADESGARYSEDPEALASALEKLQNSAKANPVQPNARTEGTASLFIVNPFSTQRIASLFSTHPPMQERVKRLLAMAANMRR